MAKHLNRRHGEWWHGGVAVAGGLLTLLVFACAGGRQPAKAQAQEVARPAPTRPAYDVALDSEARILAGLPPDDPSAFAHVVDGAPWQQYRAEFDRTWSQAAAGRFAGMRKWRDAEIGTAAEPCGTLFYPFGGPDVLNAYLLFPKCDRYVLFGLEQIGSLPALDSLPVARQERLFADVRHAAADMFERNYFITSRMSSDLSKSDLHGTISLMLLFLARLDARLISVTRVDIAANGELVPLPAPVPAPAGPNGTVRTASAGPAKLPSDVLYQNATTVPAVRIVFVGADGRKQEIVYFRGYVDDGPLKHHPGVVKYLEGLKPYKTFIKSASYLFHDPTFSTVRTLVLGGSTLIVQDDTGVPYHYLKPAEWDLRFYGKYAKPVKNFNFGYQPDLNAVYAQPGQARPLPFSYGYHWKDGASAVIVAVRRPTA